MTLEVVMVVVSMEVDKVVDEVPDMVADRKGSPENEENGHLPTQDPELQEPPVPPDPQPSKAWRCPPEGEVAHILTLVTVTACIFLAAWTMLGPIAAPGGSVFALLVLIILALIGGLCVKLFGRLLSKLVGVDIVLPPLLGMLMVGVLLKNIPYNFGQFGRAECTIDGQNATFVDSLHDLENPDHGFKRSIPDSVLLQRLERSSEGEEAIAEENESFQSEKEDVGGCTPRYIGHDIDSEMASKLRMLCLVVLLLRAGLELDPDKLWELRVMVAKATFIPCFMEAGSVAILAHFLCGFPWTVGFAVGFLLAAVSLAVIIPVILPLIDQGWGLDKGIPTLVISACAADDVVAISGFGIFLGISFSEDADTTSLLLHGPIELALGIGFGLGWGLIGMWLPSASSPNVGFFRWCVVFGGGLIACYGSHLVHYDGAGSLAAIILAFVAMVQWRKEGWTDHNPVSNAFGKMWIILEPILFALIGSEVQVDKIEPESAGRAILVLLTALIFRMLGVVIAVSGGTLNTKEKLFMAFAWLPKAAVQAAIGPVFLDNARKFNKPEWEPMGREILTLAVLSILITAPLGAISIVFLGPRLLEKQDPNPHLQGEHPKPIVKEETGGEAPPPPPYPLDSKQLTKETKELP